MTSGKRRSFALLLCSVAPLALTLALSGSIAFADGGGGGTGAAGGAPGAGGTLDNPQGTDGTENSGGGGGGAGGGSGGAGAIKADGSAGGNGGDGGAHGYDGAALPASDLTGGNGGDGAAGVLGSGVANGGGGGGGGAGGYGAVITGGGTAEVTSGRKIQGGNGGKGGFADGTARASLGDGGDGGLGLSFSGTTLTNGGTIGGGNGGTGYKGGAGGGGLLFSGSTLTNAGTIGGGNGGTGFNTTSGDGGYGLSFSGTTLTNASTGIVKGGNGNAGNGGSGAGGTGLIFSGDTLENAGAISGGSGGIPSFAFIRSGDGGAGLSFSGALLTNTGTIGGGMGATTSGGGGGEGGNGLDADGDVTNHGSVQGGDGGNGDARSFFDNVVHGGLGGTGIAIGAGTLTNTNNITGGNGGQGAPAQTWKPGNGNAGGAGVTGTGTTIVNSSAITGGAGGAGGNGAPAASRASGDGGAGGDGVKGSGLTITNSGLIAGGTGGARGIGGDETNLHGTGGAGVSGSDLAIVNSGTIAGGLAGDGTRADAIIFTGGTNRLEVWNGSFINGGVNATTGINDVLALGGAAGGTFDVLALEATGQYRGFETFEKTGAGTWTLTGITAATTPWVLKQGSLSVSSNGNLGGNAGDLTFEGGILQVTGTTFNSTMRPIVWGNGGGGFDIADAGNTFTLVQSWSNANGPFSKRGNGTLVLEGDIETGALVVSAGTLKLGNGATWLQPIRTSGVRDIVGGSSGATLIVGDASRLLVTNSFYVGVNAGETGTIKVTGNGSSLEGFMVVAGMYGDGNLIIEDQGKVDLSYLYIGSGNYDTSSTNGKATVTGLGSTLTAGTIYVGSYADGPTGSLTVSDGASVSVAGQINLATGNSTGTGSLNIGAASADPAAAVGAGQVNAASIQFWENGGLNFNHTDTNLQFAARLLSNSMGNGTINHYNGVTSLTGDNTGYFGTTHVHGGTLRANGTLGGTATVHAGGTLGGSGTVGTTTVDSGGHLAPGNSIGTLTVHGDLNLSAGSILDYELGGPGAAAGSPGMSDSIIVTGNLVLSGTLNLAQSGNPADGMAGFGYYRLMTYGGTLSDAGLTLGTTPALADPASYEIQTGGGNVDLLIAANGDDTLQHWQGGDGTWNATNLRWLNQGSIVLDDWAGNHAVFKNAPGGFSGGTIAVDGAQSFKGLQFVDSGYRLEGPGSLVVDGAGSEIRVLAGATAHIATTIAGTGGLTKTQGGTLVLTGSNSYQGGTRLLGGIVSVSSDANLGAAAGRLTFNGGTLQNTAALRTARDVTLEAGGGTLRTDARLELTGTISGDGGLTKTGTGGLVLSGANTYAGGTKVSAGYLNAATTGALGGGPVTVAAGGEVRFSNDASAANLHIAVAGGHMRFDDRASAGTATITGNGEINFYGDSSAGNATFANGGAALSFNERSSAGGATIAVGTIGFFGQTTADAATIAASRSIDISGLATGGITIGSLSGDGAVILGSKALTLGGLNKDDNIGGVIGGASGGSLIKTGTGRLTLTGENTYTGGTLVEAGMLQIGNGGAVGSIAGDVEIASAGTLAFSRQDTIAFAGTLTGSGTLAKLGTGMLELTGDSAAFDGRTTVDAGTLAVNGALGGALDIKAGGRLRGTGMVGTTTIADGATIAPGNSIGTLTVDGDITFATGSTFEAEINPALQSDLIDASGTATIKGGTVHAVKAGGVYTPGSRWTVIGADGGVTGTFDRLTQNMPFVDLALAYDASNVYIDATRNAVAFCDVARTRNQCATGGGVESAGGGNPVYDAVAAVPDEDSARQALDALSGEIHASARSVLIEDSRFVRDAMNDRLRAAFEGTGVSATPVLAYGEGGPAPASAATDRFAAWGTAFGSWGDFDGDGNAAGLDISSGGFLTGFDGSISDSVRLGIVTGYGHTSFSTAPSPGSSDNYHLGLYAGTRQGNLGFRSGLAYTWHDIETSRSVSIPGFADSLGSDRDAGTLQAFGELGYRIETPVAAFEPFANLAYVNLRTDGFAETGDAAALTGQSETTDTTFTTLGLRASTAFTLGATRATVRGMLGWRHAYGAVVPTGTHAFATGDVFTIAGVPIARDSALVEAGLDLDLNESATLGIAYQGQFGSGVERNGLTARFAVRF